MMANVYILILNWNNWQDTLNCLESVFRNDYPNYKVIICDNSSHDNSLQYIKAWANGSLDAFSLPGLEVRKHLSPPVQKPIKYKTYDRSLSECGGDLDDMESRLIIIQNNENLGFAGGNNVGIRYALARKDFNFIWLLNNDTVIRPDALSHMVKKMEKSNDIGMCGSTLIYYDNPFILQACGGGSYNKWFGYSRHLCNLNTIKTPVDENIIEAKMDYVVGASLLVSKNFLQDIGLMSEDYFLYNEDIDWAVRAKGRYRLAYVPESIVYHKEGKSTGAGRMREQKSLFSDYYFIRSRLLLTRKLFPYALPTVYLGLIISIFNRILRRQYRRVLMIMKLLFNQDKENKSYSNFINSPDTDS